MRTQEQPPCVWFDCHRTAATNTDRCAYHLEQRRQSIENVQASITRRPATPPATRGRSDNRPELGHGKYVWEPPRSKRYQR